MRSNPFVVCCTVIWAVAASAAPIDSSKVAVERGIEYDQTLGVPRMLWGAAARAPRQAARGEVATKPQVEHAGRARLGELAELYQLEGASLAAVETLEVRESGSRLVRFGQRFDGIPVLGAELALVLDADGGLILATGVLSPHAPRDRFLLDADAGARSALRHATGATDAVADLGGGAGGWRKLAPTSAKVGAFRVSELHARQAYRAEARELVPVWEVTLRLHDAEGKQSGYALQVDARDGRVLAQRSLLSDAAHSYRVWAAAAAPNVPLDGPQGNAVSPHPTGSPDGTAPVAIARDQFVVDATSYRPTRPWFTASGSSTRSGTQVDAYADPLGNDGSSGAVEATAVGGLFHFAWDPALAADANPDQIRAAIVHGFYTINHIADWFYLAGFDEAGGNHQTTNFGLGGLGGDRLVFEALDGSVINNANAWVPPDGQSPRIQMGIFTGDLFRQLDATGDAGLAMSRDRTGVGTASFGPLDYDLTDALVVARDDAGSDPFDLCEPISNGAALVGNIALVHRGTCLFVDKAAAVQTAGAIGMLVDNHTATGQPNGGIMTMAGTNPAVTIPSMFISLEDGVTLRDALTAGEAISLRLQRDAAAAIDSAVDTSIVAHEWGHVLVNRNVDINFPICGGGGGIVFIGPQPQGINEGTADVVALLYLVDANGAAASYAGAYGVGHWAIGGTELDGAYFGFRRYPYSTDMTKNPLTFRHLGFGEALPPGVPVGGGTSDNTEEHAVGEVWAVALWDAYALMLNSGRYSHAAARDRMRDYLVATLKALPNDPTFLQARDVFYAVVLARSRDDHALFAQAFAKRGMGQGASGPPLSDCNNSGIVESYAVEPTPAAPPPSPPPSGGGGGGGVADPAWLLLALGALYARRRFRPSAA